MISLRACSRRVVAAFVWNNGSTDATTFIRSFSASPKDPFDVLGLRQPCSYEAVKKAFAELALKHHPDMPNGSVQSFTEIRRAFESIQQPPGGGSSAVVRQEGKEQEVAWTSEELRRVVWDATGQDLSFVMSAKTRREVANVADTMAPGGLDRGGMWELAKTISRQEKSSPSLDEPKQLDTGGHNKRRRRKR